MRATAIGLTVYGVVGVLLLAIALAVGLEATGRIERLTSSLSATLTSSATTARSSATALTSLRDGVKQGSASAADAGRLAEQASTTSRELGAAMSVSLLGAQPLLPLAGQFGDLSAQLHSLSGNLRSMGTALETSGANLADVQVEVQGLATRLEALTGHSGVAIVPTGMLRLALGGLLLWLAIPAFGALALGVTLLRLGRSAPAA